MQHDKEPVCYTKAHYVLNIHRDVTQILSSEFLPVITSDTDITSHRNQTTCFYNNFGTCRPTEILPSPLRLL